jgi:hypothetical protein
MEAVMTMTETLPARGAAAAPPRQRARIDWKRGASLLVEGEKPSAVAAALGIAEEKLWLHLRNSLRFQFLLRQARERRQLLGRLRFEAVSGDAALRGTLHVESADGDTLKWLASQSGLSDTATDDSARDVIAQLSDTGRRPPNQAFRKRIAAERKEMDAQVAEARDFLATLQAADKAKLESDKVKLESNKTELESNKPELEAHKPEPESPKVQTAPPRPAERPPRSPSPVTRSPAIVDLTDMYGNPLPDAGGVRPG